MRWCAQMMIEKAEYPGELNERVMLPNRRSVRIRALHRGEDGPIYELDAHLSLRTRYDRFFLPRPALPESVIRQLACVDYRRQLALIAEYDGNSGREVVALASLAAIDERRAEVGLVVCDEWQQQGVGTALANKQPRGPLYGLSSPTRRDPPAL